MKGNRLFCLLLLGMSLGQPGSLGAQGSILWGSATMGTLARQRALMADYDSLLRRQYRWADQQRRQANRLYGPDRGHAGDTLLLHWTREGLRSCHQRLEEIRRESASLPSVGKSPDWEREYREWAALWAGLHQRCQQPGYTPELLSLVLYWKAAFQRFEKGFEQGRRRRPMIGAPREGGRP